MSKKLRVGVIGLGMGRNHVRAFQAHQSSEVVAVCDTNQERMDAICKEHNVGMKFTDASTMLAKADLDAVSIATPNKFHAELAIMALKNGCHVMCEKPMAMNTGESLDMKAAAETAGKNFMINFSYRFSPMSQALKTQVDSGIIGDIYFGRTVWHRRRGIPGFGGWFCDKALAGGGPLIDLCVHRLDLALWLMGFPEPVSVSGVAYNELATALAKKQGKTFNVEDLAAALIRFDNGATLIVEASWMLNIADPEHMVTSLCGTKGGLLQKNTDGGYNFAAEIYTEENGFLFTKKLDNYGVNVPSAYDEFINSIMEKREPSATADQGIKVMKILDAIYESASLNKEVQVAKTPELVTA